MGVGRRRGVRESEVEDDVGVSAFAHDACPDGCADREVSDMVFARLERR